MLGSIIGDIIGSVFEWNNVNTTNFDLFNDQSCFTDDSVLSFATARAILNSRNDFGFPDYATNYKDFGCRYPDSGYGGGFRKWLFSSTEILPAYNSFGNGSAMRVSPVGYAYNDLQIVLARDSASVTHNHREGVKGAQATCASILWARKGESKKSIRELIQNMFHYDLNRTCDDIRPTYYFDETCQGTVPEAIIAFLDSTSYEDAIRKAVSLGGDSDTLACITGGIAQAFYREIPKEICSIALSVLPDEFITIIKEFNRVYNIDYLAL